MKRQMIDKTGMPKTSFHSIFLASKIAYYVAYYRQIARKIKRRGQKMIVFGILKFYCVTSSHGSGKGLVALPDFKSGAVG